MKKVKVYLRDGDTPFSFMPPVKFLNKPVIFLRHEAHSFVPFLFDQSPLKTGSPNLSPFTLSNRGYGITFKKDMKSIWFKLGIQRNFLLLFLDK